jgi:hypothetical protein
MLSGKYITIENLVERFQRDFPTFRDDLDWIDAIEWVADCLALVGAPRAMVEKVTDGNIDLYHPQAITIENYRGRLPFDIYEVKQVRRCPDLASMRRSTDTFHMAYYCKSSCDLNCNSELTYKLNSDYIFTSFESGKVQIAYTAFPSDERGYPLIPDNQKYIEACKYYIATKVGFIKLAKGQITDTFFNRLEQNSLWYIGAADTSARMPNYDQMEGWKNMFTRLIPDLRSHGISFRNVANIENRFNSNTDV